MARPSLVAGVSGLCWLAAEVVTNAGARLAVFALVGLLVEALARTIVHERAVAREDSLSGLPNARAFRELAEHERRTMSRTGSPLTVASIDIDDFKAVNDTFGHPAGDLVLRATARALRTGLRDTDRVGRLGGDEFAALLPHTSSEGAAIVLRKLHDALVDEAATHGWPIGFSIGAITFTDTPTSVDDMVARSDHLLYEVKRHGKNGVRLAAA